MGPCTPQDTRKLKGYKFEMDNMVLKSLKHLNLKNRIKYCDIQTIEQQFL